MGFVAFKNTPFVSSVLPIIPVGCTLSPHSKITEDRKGRVPGLRYPDGWGGFPKSVPWTKHEANNGLMDTFARMYAKDGLPEVCGLNARRYPAIDMDIDDGYVSRLLEPVFERIMGPAPRRSRPNNPGRVLRCYRYDHHGSTLHKMQRTWRMPFGDTFSIEFLADGQSWTYSGPHRSGVPYEWTFGLDPIVWGHENLSIITLDQVGEAFNECTSILAEIGIVVLKGGGNTRMSGYEEQPRLPVDASHTDLCPDLDMLREVMRLMPVTHGLFTTFDEWSIACVAIVTACGRDENFWPEFLEWNIGNPDNDEQQVRGKWESVRESSIGWSYLAGLAHEVGYFPDVEEMLADLGVEMPVNDETPALPARRPMDATYEGVIAEEFIRQNALTHWAYATYQKGGEWISYDAPLWDKGQLAMHPIARLCQEVGMRLRTNDATPAQLKEAKQMFSAHTAQAVTSIVTVDPRIRVRHAHLDDHPVVFGTPEGLIGFTEIPREDWAGYLITKSTAFAPQPGDCPKFRALIAHLCNHDPEIIAFFWDLLGYTMTGLCSEQIFVFLLGKQGREGKTTFTTIMQQVLGEYARAIRNTMFVKSRGGDENKFATAMLKGCRFAYSNELELGQRWASEKLKEVTGGGDITIEHKYGGIENMRMQATIWFAGNNLPIFPPADGALQRRMVLIETMSQIPEEADQPGYATLVVKEEGPQIMAHLIAAMRAYLAKGKLLVPASVRANVAEQFYDDDLVMQFVDEKCELGEECFVSGHTLYGAYVMWARHTAELPNLLGRNTFLRLISDHPGIRKWTTIVKMRHIDTKDPSSPRGFKGIGVVEAVTALDIVRGLSA
jgi:P4 family phage/plasmid primase-like protien